MICDKSKIDNFNWIIVLVFISSFFSYEKKANESRTCALQPEMLSQNEKCINKHV